MNFGVHFHAFGEYADPHLLVELSRVAEDAGWDGVFISDHLTASSERGAEAVLNPWITLAAIATATRRVRLGPMVAAVPRRRPWQLASEAVTLDHLSGGRVVLGVGSGISLERSFAPFGEEMALRRRAAMLDEGLEVVTGLWRGEPYRFHGRHYRVETVTFLPRPLQRPRIPIWVAGHWPFPKPFQRAARWDGMFVDVDGVDWRRGEIVPPDALRECVRFTLAARREAGPFEVVIGGFSPHDPALAAARLAPYAGTGLTWWVEGIHQDFGSPEVTRARLQRGPPRP